MPSDSARFDRTRDDFAYDPAMQPELFDDVRKRRVMAYLLDLLFISILVVVLGALVAVVGIVTLGLGWLLYGILVPGTAILYVAFTLGGPYCATPGMRIMGLEMRLWYGAKPYMLLAVVHAVLFYGLNVILTPFIVLVSLFNERKQLLHDIVLGTVVVNSSVNLPDSPPHPSKTRTSNAWEDARANSGDGPR